MTYEHTQEDKEILSAMGIAEDDSTINDETESEEEETQETEEEISEQEETDGESESEEEEDESEEASQEQKPKKGIAKVLAQRNEARKESEMLREELERLKGNGKGKSSEYMETLVKQQVAEREEISEYFEENEELRPYKAEIKAYAKESGLSFEKSVTLYLAENNPELLLDKQTRNRKKAKVYDVPAHTPQKVKTGKTDYSDEEFEKRIKSGEITL